MKQIKRIYFFIAYPWGMHLQLDKALAATAGSVDIPVEIIICNQFQSRWGSHCEVAERETDPASYCAACHNYVHSQFNAFPITKLTWEADAESLMGSMVPDVSNLSVDGLLDLEVFGLFPFRYAYSTLCTRYRVGSLDLLPEWRGLFFEEALLCLRLWCALDAHYGNRDLEDSCLMIFNGRFSPYRTCYEYFQSRGARSFVHERGCKDNSYRIIQNRRISEAQAVVSGDIQKLFMNESCSQTKKLMHRFTELRILEKINGRNTGWASFVRNEFAEDALEEVGPSKWKTKEHETKHSYDYDFGFYPSSPDEFESKNKQTRANEMVSHFATMSKDLLRRDYSTIIRHHPNSGPDHLGRSVNRHLGDAKAFAEAFTTSIFPLEGANSVELACSCRLNIIPFSSICIEVGLLCGRCLVDSESIFAGLFPARFHLKGPADYTADNLIRKT